MFKNCLYCTKSYRVKPFRAHISKFCSLKCKGLNERIFITRNCETCGNEFNHICSRVNKAKYCSAKCYNKSQIGRGFRSYSCVYCSKKFKDSPSRQRKYCSKQCVNKCLKERFLPKFTTVRKAMLIRGLIDKCQQCGYNEFKEILGVHHIDKNRENNALENLMTLCPNCHSLVHRKHLVH